VSNLLKTLRREADTWVRDPEAARSNMSRAERIQRERARKNRTAARRFAGAPEVERPIIGNGAASYPKPTILARLRAMFAPSASQRGR
jgi:hypothetical protein